jgi:curved DNA-binding protein CbpA
MLLLKGAITMSVDDNEKDYYEILKIDRDASLSEIKRAYRQLALTSHPDKGGDPEVFDLISKAHETLSDPTTRLNYDINILDITNQQKKLPAEIADQFLRERVFDIKMQYGQLETCFFKKNSATTQKLVQASDNITKTARTLHEKPLDTFRDRVSLFEALLGEAIKKIEKKVKDSNSNDIVEYLNKDVEKSQSSSFNKLHSHYIRFLAITLKEVYKDYGNLLESKQYEKLVQSVITPDAYRFIKMKQKDEAATPLIPIERRIK